MALRIPQTPVYLARASYRQRRLRDAARVLPIAGTILWILPVLSYGGATGATSLYIFFVWMVLIVLTRVITVLLKDDAEQPLARSLDFKPE